MDTHFNYIRLVGCWHRGRIVILGNTKFIPDCGIVTEYLLTFYPDQKPFSLSSLYRLAKLSVPDRRLSLAAALASSTKMGPETDFGG